MSLFQMCLDCDESGAVKAARKMIGKTKPAALWAIIMHSAAWHEERTYDTPHAMILTNTIHRMIEDLGPNSAILVEEPENTLNIPNEFTNPLQKALVERLALYVTAIDHYAREKGPRYNVDAMLKSPDNALYDYSRAVRERSQSGVLKAAIILGSRPHPIRLLRMTASLGAEEPDSLGHAFIMPVSLVTELPKAEFKLPLIASLWHLAEYLVRKVPNKSPYRFSVDTKLGKFTNPTDVSKYAEHVASAVVNFGILGHNGIFAHRIVDAAQKGVIERKIVNWLMDKLKQNLGGNLLTKKDLDVKNLIKSKPGTNWEQIPSILDLPHSENARTWISDNFSSHWRKMVHPKSSTFEEAIPEVQDNEWPLIRATQYALSSLYGASTASHVMIYAHAAWSLTDSKVISKPLAALQVHRMLREYLKGR
ncbi:MAG: hypothetical protein PVG65_02430 [Candidatus Thorarchaeota archaeon]|jgi:hypothetical protein